MSLHLVGVGDTAFPASDDDQFATAPGVGAHGLRTKRAPSARSMDMPPSIARPLKPEPPTSRHCCSPPATTLSEGHPVDSRLSRSEECEPGLQALQVPEPLDGRFLATTSGCRSGPREERRGLRIRSRVARCRTRAGVIGATGPDRRERAWKVLFRTVGPTALATARPRRTPRRACNTCERPSVANHRHTR